MTETMRLRARLESALRGYIYSDEFTLFQTQHPALEAELFLPVKKRLQDWVIENRLADELAEEPGLKAISLALARGDEKLAELLAAAFAGVEAAGGPALS